MTNLMTRMMRVINPWLIRLSLVLRSPELETGTASRAQGKRW